jgi:hypothetical protein
MVQAATALHMRGSLPPPQQPPSIPPPQFLPSPPPFPPPSPFPFPPPYPTHPPPPPRVPPPLIPPLRPLPPSLSQVLNARFVHGHPSNDPAEAGIFVISFSHTFSWPEDRWNFYGQRSHVKADHASGSIVNLGQRWSMCDLACGAFVVDPAFVARALVCTYPEDGATTGRENFGCPTWNQNAYPAGQLAKALQKQREMLPSRHCTFGHGWIRSCYNEAILRGDGPDGWYGNLPNAIQAVVFSHMRADRWADAACEGCKDWAEGVRKEHESLLKHFGVSAQSIPLLQFDWDSMDAPFTERLSWT